MFDFETTTGICSTMITTPIKGIASNLSSYAKNKDESEGKLGEKDKGVRCKPACKLNDKNTNTNIRSITINKSKKVVTVVFKDGSVRMSKCTKEDTFDVNVGVAMCIAYQLFDGSKSAFRKEVENKSKMVTEKEKVAKKKVNKSKNN